MKRIAIFASGSGSNAQRIMEHFKRNKEMEVALVLCNKPDAYVLQRADNFEVPTHVFTKDEMLHTNSIDNLLKNLEIDIIVLAGFMWLLPDRFIQNYPKRIINIHPALLPKFGGEGMFGKKVHTAVLQSKEIETGITIHYVNEHFDEGEIIYQSKCAIEKTDDAEKLAYKVHQLEHIHYPKIIEDLLKKLDKKVYPGNH
jgi:phosphoribosylglycinamide formyltransferase-1